MGPIDALPRPLAVAIHDAGAANMIAAWAEAADCLPERVLAGGPARAIWSERFGEDALVEGAELLDEAAALLSGTGWASDLEHDARKAARARGIRSVAVIDHWVNYRPRFERDGAEQLPDDIWVGDDYARAIAEEIFDDLPIEQHDNLYLAKQAEAAGPVPEDGDVLFVAEPARSDWGRNRPGEFQALDHLLANRNAAGIAADVPLRLRPHPSDPPGKYDNWLAEHEDATLDRSPDMASALSRARWVVGLNSFALVIALEAGRMAVSSLPPWAPPCVLPHCGILKL